MKDATVKIGLDAEITIILSEIEARALYGIFVYDVNIFLKVFYEKMGTAYVKPYEEGVRSLHERIRKLLNGPLWKVNEARNKLFAKP